jgi:CHAD domain-containing protein
MAFVLKRRKSVANQLRHLVAQQLGGAVEGFSNSTSLEKAVHDARKRVKKVRAVLRVLHDSLGSHYRTENERLRRVSHRLASWRDADAIGETLQKLRGRYPRVITSRITREMARGIEGHNHQAGARGRRQIDLAAGELGRTSKSLPDRIRTAARFKAVRRGVTRGWRRAGQAMESLDVSSDAAQFHLWRRRVKDHWYQMRLMAARVPAARTRARTLKKLERWLGDDHNLAMLRAAILAAPSRFGGARTTDIVLGCIVKYQAWLRARCLKLGRRVFAKKPATFWKSPDTR